MDPSLVQEKIRLVQFYIFGTVKLDKAHLACNEDNFNQTIARNCNQTLIKVERD